MLSEEGVGKMLLSERRVGPVKALQKVFDQMVEDCPELKLEWCEELPESVEDGVIYYVPEHREKDDFPEWVKTVVASSVVICSQELCHQVSAVYRYQ